MKTSVVKNYMYNIGYQCLVIILPLITTPYLSRVLGAYGIGAFGYTESISQYFVLFGCIGLNLYGQREIAYYQNNPQMRTKIFYELCIVRVLTVSIALFIFGITACQSSKYGMLFKVQIIEIISSMIDISWFFQGMEEFKKIVIRNSVVKIAGVILIFSFVNVVDDLIKYAFIYTITLFCGNVSMWLYVPKYVRRIKLNEINCRRHLRPAIVLFIPQIATSMYNLLDKSMIGLLTKNDAEVAYYEQAQKIIKMLLAIPTALGTVMLPRIANMYGEGKDNEIKEYLQKSMRFICMLSFPLCFGVIAVAKGLVPWFFGPGYDKVVVNIYVIAPIIFFVGISNVIGVQYFLPVGKQKEYTFSVIIGTIVNLILNSFFIPQLLSVGAAIASIMAEVSVTIYQLIIVRKEFNLKKTVKNTYKYLIAAPVMFICCLWVYQYEISGIICTVLQICTGIIVYGGMLFILKDKLILSIIKKVKDE